MDATSRQNDRPLVTLNRISEMIVGRTPLPDIFRTLAAAVQELSGAPWSLFIHLAHPRAPKFYGPEEALPLGPSLLQALEQAALSECAASLQTLKVQVPSSTPGALAALALPIFQGKTLKGALAALYEKPPDNPPLSILFLLHNQARIAMEKRHLEEITTESYTGTIRALASAIDARDPSTHRHSQAVTELSVSLAETLNLSEQEINTIRHAAILHDVGKIGIGEDILFKAGPLTPRERIVVEAHPLVGVSILAGIPHLEDLIPLIRHHHERYDGSGYPDGLRDAEIPLGAQILAIADTFDAITTERFYHRGLSIPKACSFLQENAGVLFDPELVETFVRMIQQRLENLDPDQ